MISGTWWTSPSTSKVEMVSRTVAFFRPSAFLLSSGFGLYCTLVQTTPSGVMRDHILQVVNDTLARCAAEEKTSAEEPAAVPEALEEAPDQSKVTQEEHKKLSLQRKGQAFGRAYTVLRRCTRAASDAIRCMGQEEPADLLANDFLVPRGSVS